MLCHPAYKLIQMTLHVLNSNFNTKNADWALPDQDGKEEAQAQIEELEKEKKKLERKLAALTAKSSALKEANESQAVTLDGLQVIP